jgi:DivIVA domain-containing protein
MSRFGWPRPKAEGITEELAALQAAQGKVPGDVPDGLPPGVRAGGAFPKSSGKGYDPAAVDAFLADAASATVEEIRAVRFATVRKNGYDITAVDDALDRLERDARRAGR